MYTVEEHEVKMNELATNLKLEGVDQGKISLIIQDLRDNYTALTNDFTKNTKTIETMTSTNEGLRSANMTLLSKLGTSFADLESRDKESLKNKNNNNQNKDNEETPMSFDDIAKEFLK